MKGTPLGTDHPRRGVAFAAAAALTFGLAADHAAADKLIVQNTKPKGPGSFVAAVRKANRDHDLDKIRFSRRVKGKIRLRHDVEMKSSVDIAGRGYGTRGKHFKRIVLHGPRGGVSLELGRGLTSKPGTRDSLDQLYLDRVAIDAAFPESTPYGHVKIEHSFITGRGEVDLPGVAITHYDRYSDPKLEIGSTTIEGFRTGVVADSTEAHIGHSTIADNVGGGGLVADAYAAIDVDNSTISGNVVGFDDAGHAAGGGVSAGYYSHIDMSNSTISGNSALGANSYAGGIVGSVRVNESTITGNAASAGGAFGGGKYYESDDVILSNSIVAGNTATTPGGPTDCDKKYFKSDGGNLIEDPGDCELRPTDLGGVDPRLGDLRDNGGPTLTHALASGSPAIGLALKGIATEQDQRGVQRDKHPDSGAYERR